ncbi:MAG: signal recognition particle protein [Dehalococcoidales bacterium]|nr:signal recognition particle protein [Dehalococcoidales bacterium]
MFESLSDRLQATLTRLRGKGRLTERDVDEAMREVRLALLEADVNFKVVKTFVGQVRERAVGVDVLESLTPAQQVVKIVNEELIKVLGEPGKLSLGGTPPHTVMLVGLQGAGKTTAAAKLALQLRKQGQRPLLVAADVRRPAAIQQLITLGKQVDAPVFSETNAQPPDIAVHALNRARETASSVVIIDTAGRLHIDEEMMDEVASIRQKVEPDEVLLVADAMTGQDAVRVADEFNKKVGLTGLILTKVDSDARGGAAISMRSVTGVPIKYVGVGEKLDALEPFYPDRLASRILGMGDVLSLIERAQQTMDQKQTAVLEKKLRNATFDLNDFVNQLQQVRKMGPLSELLSMIPGLGGALKQVPAEALDEKQMKRVEAIIFSMTPQERHSPDVIDGSRKRRIARGSGTNPQEVNQLLNQFKQMQKMMRSLVSQQGKGRKQPPRFPMQF